MRWTQEEHADLGLIPDSDRTEDMRRSASDSSNYTLCRGTTSRFVRMVGIAESDVRVASADSDVRGGRQGAIDRLDPFG
jgi:hypothetical protein